MASSADSSSSSTNGNSTSTGSCYPIGLTLGAVIPGITGFTDAKTAMVDAFVQIQVTVKQGVPTEVDLLPAGVSHPTFLLIRPIKLGATPPVLDTLDGVDIKYAASNAPAGQLIPLKGTHLFANGMTAWVKDYSNTQGSGSAGGSSSSSTSSSSAGSAGGSTSTSISGSSSGSAGGGSPSGTTITGAPITKLYFWNHGVTVTGSGSGSSGSGSASGSSGSGSGSSGSGSSSGSGATPTTRDATLQIVVGYNPIHPSPKQSTVTPKSS